MRSFTPMRAPVDGGCVHCKRAIDPADRDERLRVGVQYALSGWRAHLACCSVPSDAIMDGALLARRGLAPTHAFDPRAMPGIHLSLCARDVTVTQQVQQ